MSFLSLLMALLLLPASPLLAQDELPPELDRGQGKYPELPLPGFEPDEPEEQSLELIPSLTLTRADFDESLSYSGEHRLDQWLGDIDIEGGLGELFFPGSLRLRGDLRSFPGSRIKVGGELRCGGSLELQD